MLESTTTQNKTSLTAVK